MMYLNAYGVWELTQARRHLGNSSMEVDVLSVLWLVSILVLNSNCSLCAHSCFGVQASGYRSPGVRRNLVLVLSDRKTRLPSFVIRKASPTDLFFTAARVETPSQSDMLFIA